MLDRIEYYSKHARDRAQDLQDVLASLPAEMLRRASKKRPAPRGWH